MPAGKAAFIKKQEGYKNNDDQIQNGAEADVLPPKRNFGQIQQMISESYAEYRAARTYVYDTARRMRLDASGQRLDSDGVKLFAAPVAKTIADRAIQVLGGYGYVGEYVVERLWRDAKLLEIGGGTNEAHQKNICRDLMKNGMPL